MKFLILGGGISGLSAAWFLRKKYPDAKITLLEKESRLGGWIRTSREDYFFEKGPRTFQASRSPALLQLIRDAGLEEELIFSDPSANRRFLWHKGKLRSVGSMIPRILPSLLLEPFIPKGTWEDESIYDFAARRFSPRAAETLFDPLTLGIYGGDIRKLSIRSCFPKLFEWEQEKGSVLRGMFSSRGKKKKTAGGLFSLKYGMESLIRALERQSSVEVIYNCEAEAIRPDGIWAGRRVWSADRIYSALPANAAGKLLGEEFSVGSMWEANLVFEGDVLPKRGFGYLVPSREKEDLLGMIFDSSVFPQQNSKGETRLTALLRSETPDPEKAALLAAKKHLGIQQEPVKISLFYAKKSIPQFEVGYHQKIARFEERAKQKFPFLSLLGNYIEGPSVESCIQRSFKIIL